MHIEYHLKFTYPRTDECHLAAAVQLAISLVIF